MTIYDHDILHIAFRMLGTWSIRCFMVNLICPMVVTGFRFIAMIHMDIRSGPVLSRELLWSAGAGRCRQEPARRTEDGRSQQGYHSNQKEPTEGGGNAAGPCQPCRPVPAPAGQRSSLDIYGQVIIIILFS